MGAQALREVGRLRQDARLESLEAESEALHSFLERGQAVLPALDLFEPLLERVVDACNVRTGRDRVGGGGSIEPVEPLLERRDAAVERGEVDAELLETGELFMQPLQRACSRFQRRSSVLARSNKARYAAPAQPCFRERKPLRLPVLCERACEVEPREASLRDEDLADPAALRALNLERGLELRARDEPQLDEDLADPTAPVVVEIVRLRIVRADV